MRQLLEADHDPMSGRVQITRTETLVAHPGDEKYADLMKDFWVVFDQQNNIPEPQA